MKPAEFLVASILILGILGAMATCDPGNGSSSGSTSGSVHCVVMADSPADVGDANRVTGTARYYCESPGASLNLTVRLQKQKASGEGWTDLSKRSFTVSAKNTLRTDDERYHTQAVSVGCSEGTFRTVVTGSSTAHGKTTKYDHTSPRATNPC